MWTTFSPSVSRAAPIIARLAMGLPGLALALFLIPGCGDDSAGIPVACTGDQACPPPSTLIPWAAQLQPSTSDSSDPQQPLLPQEAAKVLFDASGMAQLQYRTPAKCHGTVTSSDKQPLVRARVLALLPTLIPGQSSLNLNTLTADQPAGFWSLRVPLPENPAAQSYRFWVGFDDASLASIYPPVWLDSVIAVADNELPLTMRPPTELATVYGRITNPLGDGVGGLTVQVLDTDNQIVSSTAISQTAGMLNPGSYQLFVDPNLSTDAQASLRVVVRPGTANPAQPTLEATLPPLLAATQTRVDLAFPSQRTPVQFQLPVRGLSPSGTMTAIANAHVQAQVQLQDQTTLKLGVRATYTVTADTDAQGIAKLTLVPANSGGANLSYLVAVTSPTQAPFASMQQMLPIGSSEGLLAAVTLPLRAQLLGRLLDASGTPVPNAQVTASVIASTDHVASPFTLTVTDAAGPQTTTDMNGHFALSVDPGDYDLELIPVPGTQPRSSLDNQRIGTADRDVGDIRLPAISLGKLLVTNPSGTPVRDTKVRIFQLPDLTPRYGIACVESTPCSRVAKLRAEAFTNHDGLAQFLLPASTPFLMTTPGN